MTAVKVTTRPTCYLVSALDHKFDVSNYHLFVLRVEYDSRSDAWGITHGAFAADSAGAWEYMMNQPPTLHEDEKPNEQSWDDFFAGNDDIRTEWAKTYRFDLPTALRLAERLAPTVTINRVTVADIIAMREAGGADV